MRSLSAAGPREIESAWTDATPATRRPTTERTRWLIARPASPAPARWEAGRLLASAPTAAANGARRAAGDAAGRVDAHPGVLRHVLRLDRPGQLADERVLRVVGVLILVDQHVPEPALEMDQRI